MGSDWKYLLGKLRSKMGKKEERAETFEGPGKNSKPQQALRVNLGIDFGTSYTKVCFFDANEQASGIVKLGPCGIISSNVHLSDDGRLYMAHRLPDSVKTSPIQYLKMQLAELEDEPEKLRQCKALSAWFLANVLEESQDSLMQQEKDRFVGRFGLWSANIGVPVEWYDNEVLGRFDEVLRVAWQWHQSGRIPPFVEQALSAYEDALNDVRTAPSDFHAIPEIAAAVQSFVISREATPGLYLYFDIGGGTLDGVVFKIRVEDGMKYIDFLSGKVGNLGMVRQSDTPEFWRNVQQFVGTVVYEGKSKDRSDWRKRKHDNQRNIVSINRMPDDSIEPLVVFLGGYGSRDEKYKEKIAATYEDFDHRSSGIPPYQLSEVKKPNDLIDRGQHEFRRFAIAYGLSIPFGQGPEVRLPSQIADDPGPKRRRLANVPDYLDSKDWC